MTLNSDARPYVLFLLVASLAWVCLALLSTHLYTNHTESRQLRKLAEQNIGAVRDLEAGMGRNLQLMQYTVAPYSRWSGTVNSIATENHNTGINALSQENRRHYYERQPRLRYLNTELAMALEVSDMLDHIWVMKADGTTIASSNAYAEDSFVGARFEHRDYFKDAMSGKKGYQYATGSITGVPGIYFSSPVYQDSLIIGIVASKVNLSAFSSWVYQANGMLIDRYGVIIKASAPHFELMALSDSTYESLTENQRLLRYGKTGFAQLAMTPWQGGDYSSIMQLGDDPTPYHVAYTQFVDDRLRMMVITDVSDVLDRTGSRFFLVLLSAGGVLLIFSGTGVHYYFRRLQNIQQREQVTLQKINSARVRADAANSHFAIMEFSLDNFASISTDLGFKNSDFVLNTVGSRISQAISGLAQLLQSNRDAFVVLLEDMDNRQDAERVFARVQNAIAQPLEVQGQELTLSASVGIAMYPADAQTAQQLLQRANTALKSIFGTRVACHAFYNPEMSSNFDAYSQLIVEMKQSLDDRDFFLVYQPLLSLTTGQMIGCEALVRWKHPDRGTVSPGEFIPIAESTGFIHKLGPWILDEACRQASEWQKEHGMSIKVSVNISAEQFLRGDLLQQVWEAVARHGITPEQLELEITETLLMSDTERTLGIIQGFQERGLQVSIDDFGTGYSSLAYLRKFDANILKIDRAFIQEMVSNKSDLAVVSAIISMAKNLDYQVIAEGVETLEQLVLLMELGCHAIQGFGFSRPLPPDEFARFFMGHKGGIHLADWKSTVYFGSDPSQQK